MKARTILVAFCVTGCESMEEAQRRLMRQLPDPDHPGIDSIDSWWIAEDERYDGSDNDSAEFIDKARKEKERAVFDEILDWAHAQDEDYAPEWVEALRDLVGN